MWSSSGAGRPTLALAAGGLVQEVVEQHRQVLPALAQGRDMHAVAAEPVVEVLAEPAAVAGGLEVLVGGHHDARVRALGDVGAERQVLAVLQQPQQLHLGDRAQVADLVQEERAGGGLLEQPGAGLQRLGESALLVAEEGVGEDVVVQAGHVDGHEVPPAAAQDMHRARHELLAHPGLARDQERPRAGRHRLDVLEDRTHRRADGDDVGEGLRPVQAAGEDTRLEQLILAVELAQLDAALHTADQAAASPPA